MFVRRFEQYFIGIQQVVTSDDERTFHSVSKYLASFGVSFSTTPANYHEKRAERYIQVSNSCTFRIFTIRTTCHFALYIIKCMNSISTKTSYPYTPSLTYILSQLFPLLLLVKPDYFIRFIRSSR